MSHYRNVADQYPARPDYMERNNMTALQHQNESYIVGRINNASVYEGRALSFNQHPSSTYRENRYQEPPPAVYNDHEYFDQRIHQARAVPPAFRQNPPPVQVSAPPRHETFTGSEEIEPFFQQALPRQNRYTMSAFMDSSNRNVRDDRSIYYPDQPNPVISPSGGRGSYSTVNGNPVRNHVHPVELGGNSSTMAFDAGRGRYPLVFPTNTTSACRCTNQENFVKRPKFCPKIQKLEHVFEQDKDENAQLEEDADIVVTGVTDRFVCERWTDMNLDHKLLNNIKLSDFRRPRNVQRYTVPLILDGYDCKVQCETGSGKTATFLIPITQMILQDPQFHPQDRMQPLALIIAPTRELVEQLFDQARKWTAGTEVTVGRCYGEYHFLENVFDLRRDGCHILIACLGRLLHLLNEQMLKLSKVNYFVIDEADRFLEGETGEKVHQLMNFFDPRRSRQTLMFSATLDETGRDVFTNYMRFGRTVEINATSMSNRRVRYYIKAVNNTAAKYVGIVNFLKAISVNRVVPRVLVFVNKKPDTDSVAAALSVEGFNATTIHSDRGPELREEALREFRSGRCPVLVATDVCARGVDIKNLDYVINFDLPWEHSTFVQRCGRTGRTHSGTAVSFYQHDTDMRLANAISRIMMDAGQEPPTFFQYGPTAQDIKWCQAPSNMDQGYESNRSSSSVAEDEAEVCWN